MYKKLFLTAVIGLLFTSGLSAQQSAHAYLSSDELPNIVRFLPPPPPEGSLIFGNDELQYRLGKTLREGPRGERAIREGTTDIDTMAMMFSGAFGMPLSRAATPAILHMADRSVRTIRKGAVIPKKYYQRTRPFIYYGEPTLIPEAEEELRNSGSFPSGHAVRGWALALVLSELNPARQDTLLAAGYEWGESRVIAGFHWQSDIDAARLCASAGFARLQSIPEFQQDFAAAKEEFERLRSSRIVRLGSYNVGAFSKEMDDSSPEIARFLDASGFETVALHEVDSCNGRHAVDQLAALAGKMGAAWKYSYGRAMPYRGGAYGNGVVTKEIIIASGTIALPRCDGSEPRSCAWIETPDYVFGALHLDHISEAARLEQLKVVTEAMKQYFEVCGKPIFLAGDFNDTPGSAVLQEAGRDWEVLTPPSFSHPADVPDECIDYIMQLKGTGFVKLLSSEVMAAPHAWSDHLPVRVELMLQ